MFCLSFKINCSVNCGLQYVKKLSLFTLNFEGIHHYKRFIYHTNITLGIDPLSYPFYSIKVVNSWFLSHCQRSRV
jgi:hypothetical protein